MPCVLVESKGSALLALVRILPDEDSQASEEREHQAYCDNASNYYIIDKHDGLLRLPSV
ncbi:hypothetical protein D3C81_2189910 [compost metagenome]